VVWVGVGGWGGGVWGGWGGGVVSGGGGGGGGGGGEGGGGERIFGVNVDRKQKTSEAVLGAWCATPRVSAAVASAAQPGGASIVGWREEKVLAGSLRYLTLRYSLPLSVWVDSRVLYANARHRRSM